MSPKILLVLVIAFVLIIPNTDALWGGRRRRWVRFRIRVPPKSIRQFVCTKVCSNSCTYYTGQGTICRLSCPRVCKWVNKKVGDEPDNTPFNNPPALEDESDSTGDRYTVPLPNMMSTYDTNKDGRISLPEFKAIFPDHDTDKASVMKGFDSIDTNGDHFVDCKEFLQVKFSKTSPTKC